MNYLIASHGRYASGLANAVKSLTGKDGLNIVCAYLDERPIGDLLSEVFSGKENEEWIVLTDILGGSVNQEIMRNYMSDNVHLIAGATVDTVLRVLEIDPKKDIKKQIREIVLASKERIEFVNTLITK